MYNSLKKSNSDLQIVPDDGYNSPVHSPYYYTTDSAKSPASSITSTGDSAFDEAFDELQAVIPDLNNSDNISEESYESCNDMANFGIYGSSLHSEISSQSRDDYYQSTPNMYEAASPHSDSEYSEPLSPTGVFMQAVVHASAKRSYPQYQASTINFDDFGQEEPPKKKRGSEQVMTQPEALAAYTALLYANNQSRDNRSLFFTPSNEDSGIDVKPALYETSPKTQNLSGSLTSQPFLLDDDILTSKFSVLAEFLDTQECQQKNPEDMSGSPVNIKEEPEEETLAESQGSIDSSGSPNHMLTQFVTNFIQSQIRQGSSCGQASQTTPLSEPLPKTASFPQQQLNNCQLSVAEMCKKEAQKPSGVVFFKVPKENKETVKPSKEKEASVKITVPINPQDIVIHWKGAAKTKRPNLVSHSSKPRLYNFLLELLNDRNARCIEWLDEEQGIFKFINSSEIARLWGQRKNKPNMKYENFARSLRTYVAKGILTKPRNKLVYQFRPNFH